MLSRLCPSQHTRVCTGLEFMTFPPALLSCVLVVLACYLHCGTIATYVVLGCTVALVLGFQSAFVYTCLYAFPYNGWAWSSVFGGLTWLVPGFESEARAHAEVEQPALQPLASPYPMDGEGGKTRTRDPY